MIKVVSFDVWNTLLDLGAFFQCLARCCSKHLEVDHRKVLDIMMGVYGEMKKARRSGTISDDVIVDVSVDRMCQALSLARERWFECVDLCVDTLPMENIVFEDVVEILDNLKNRGLKLAILGNVLFWYSSYTKRLLKNIGIDKYFDAQLFGDEIKVSKPRREAFLTLCKRFGVEPEEVVHVGDGLAEDFAGALAVGMKAVLIDRSCPLNIVAIKSSGYIVSDLRYIALILEMLGNAK